MLRTMSRETNGDRAQILNLIGELDPDLIQCEQCRRYKILPQVTIYTSPTGKAHPYCNDCFIPSSDD